MYILWEEKKEGITYLNWLNFAKQRSHSQCEYSPINLWNSCSWQSVLRTKTETMQLIDTYDNDQVQHTACGKLWMCRFTGILWREISSREENQVTLSRVAVAYDHMNYGRAHHQEGTHQEPVKTLSILYMCKNTIKSVIIGSWQYYFLIHNSERRLIFSTALVDIFFSTGLYFPTVTCALIHV